MAALANTQKRLSDYEAVAGKTRAKADGLDRATVFFWPTEGGGGEGGGGPVIGSRIIRGLGAL
jgi:hypothetical protein